MKKPLLFTLCVIAFAPCVGLAAESDVLKEAGAMQLQRVSVRVEAVDQKNRIVTLKGASGNVYSLTVGEEVRNLPQIKVGDRVDIDHYEAVAIDVKKTDAEPSLTVTTDMARAKKGAAPRGVVLRKIHIVTDVVGVNKDNQSILIRGPLGHLTQVKVRDPKLITDLQAGGQVDLTYIEGMAVAVHAAQKP
ncbi:MAG TPA: hypothetical protein VJU83_09010 [Burkholderiales bacterium]|nr:hypothetical protein [Burkholderiales bacterium]